MADDRLRRMSALLDWENELKYNEQILKSPMLSEADKAQAQKRIEEAKAWIAKIRAM